MLLVVLSSWNVNNSSPSQLQPVARERVVRVNCAVVTTSVTLYIRMRMHRLNTWLRD